MTLPQRIVVGPICGVPRVRSVIGWAISLALHALVFTLAFTHLGPLTDKPNPPTLAQQATVLYIERPAPEQSAPAPVASTPMAQAPASPPKPLPAAEVAEAVEAVKPGRPASMAAPPAPTAAEWAFAATYTLKNSKGYRYTWGQQVRSMMGAAVEGPDQGMVRFRVEIASNGTLARLDTLWSTSEVAERLARQAVGSMPQWPPTPTGKPLIFEKTISFSPFASDAPPRYKDDCLPDAPAFSNSFAWDGRSARVPVQAKPQAKPQDKPDPQVLEDCLKQLPQDSMAAESAHDQRLMDQWGWRSSRPSR